jgi:hypothetical protein
MVVAMVNHGKQWIVRYKKWEFCLKVLPSGVIIAMAGKSPNEIGGFDGTIIYKWGIFRHTMFEKARGYRNGHELPVTNEWVKAGNFY